MSRRCMVLLVCMLAGCTQSFMQQAEDGAQVACRVVGVQDGDTLTCLTADRESLRVRLAQIDAPERKQPFGAAAKRQLSDKVFDRQVRLRVSGTDRYKRTLAEVHVNGVNINQAMVLDGYAWAYREYLSDDRYLRLENEARQARRGLWQDVAPVYPADFRRQQQRR